MLKTNSKAVKDAVKAYILECVGEEFLSENENDGTPKGIVTAVYKTMCDEWWRGFERQRTPNRYEALKQYAMCLPSSFCPDFTYYGQRELLKKWLDETPEESDKYEDDKMSKLFYHLISREFYAMLDA